MRDNVLGSVRPSVRPSVTALTAEPFHVGRSNGSAIVVTVGRTDGTNYIISLASWSIKMQIDVGNESYLSRR